MCEQKVGKKYILILTMKLKDKLNKLEISIPDISPALGSYVPYKKIDNYIYISGQLPTFAGNIITGKVPSNVNIENAKSAAEICIINSMPLIIEASNNANIENIQCISISGFINANNDFVDHPEIINGASDLISKIFGVNGQHSRIAVGCNSLPKNACVEISSIFFLDK